MDKRIFATYLRVSTQKQGVSQLGLEHQRFMCNKFIEDKNGLLGKEFVDIESGTHRDRRGLWSAIEFCNKNGCPLVIATLSRLARDVEFCFKVINTGIEIYFVDMPQINTLLLGVFASVAQYERELTSERTKNALAAKKARGEALGAKCEKWIESYNKKTKEQKKSEAMERGKMKNERYVQNRDTQAFLKVLKNVFPDVCVSDDATEWDWTKINTKGDARDKIIGLMRDYKDLDESGTLFHKWNFDLPKKKVIILMRAHLSNIKKTILIYKRNKELSLSTLPASNN